MNGKTLFRLLREQYVEGGEWIMGSGLLPVLAKMSYRIVDGRLVICDLPVRFTDDDDLISFACKPLMMEVT